MDQGLVNRLEARPTEADVVITKDAELLEIAAQRGLLDKIDSPAIKAAIPAEFMDPEGRYFVDAFRGRVIFYAKARVGPSELSSYEDLRRRSGRGASASARAATTTTWHCSASSCPRTGPSVGGR
jgi:iron(III) transport system substrate-binding protein